GEFGLKSTAFDGLGSEDEVYSRAKSLMPTVNGIASMCEPGFRNVGLAGGVVLIDAVGNRSRYVYAATSDAVRMGGSADAAGGVVAPRGPTPADAAMGVALKEEVVSRALQFFSQEKNWVNLYRVLDAIREDLGGLKAVENRGWVAAKE